MNTTILRPRAHRAHWARLHPEAMIDLGGLISEADLNRWACDICMAPLDPEAPILVIGGPEGHSVCADCAAKNPGPAKPCPCPGCQS